MIGLVVGGVFAVILSAVLAILFIRLARKEDGRPRPKPEP
jgi:hypothetical protein